MHFWLAVLACYELIQMIIDHNNLANFETWIFFKWVFKTFVAVMLITNTFNITMAVFDVTQHVINASAGIISGNTAIDASALETMEETLMAMDLGPLLGLFLQSFIVQVTMSALAMITRLWKLRSAIKSIISSVLIADMTSTGMTLMKSTTILMSWRRI